MTIKKLRELCDTHNLLLRKIEGSDKNSVLDILHFLFDVISVLEYAALGLFELIDTFQAVFYVLGNTQTEPVVILFTLIHQTI